MGVLGVSPPYVFKSMGAMAQRAVLLASFEACLSTLKPASVCIDLKHFSPASTLKILN